MLSAFKTKLTVPCTVEVSHTFESLHAHVVLPDGINAEPGDEIIVHGSDIRVPYGEVASEERQATIVRATMIERFWVRLTGDLEFMELCEFSFSEKVAA
ncbi:hypothetical protein RDV64_22065 [Acuticoccus sp. MNP-M23]|uniref:hypothetical protein n=1 Tax=Acuticoccus sp. MNP-M23 TaxID=3072793 RepID=UPI00281591FB|nr:hypothetical protein [Acuticoccus sp. MNP-M23]WMS42707.1 hypothetical protein RDV64_22065 [Acuticoccus sp. MNP-M23]